MKSIAVYCGASAGNLPIYKDTASLTGAFLAQQDIQIIYGAGNIGLMGAVADSCLEHQGKIIGVIPHFLKDLEVAHEGLTELILCDSMHKRKVIMTDLSEGAIILPGGFGTLDELFEIITLIQLSQVEQKVGILNVNGFYDHLFQHINKMVDEGFVKPIHRDIVCFADNIEDLVAKMRTKRNSFSIEDKL